MLQFKNFRKWALALPDTEEKLHFAKPSFRIGDRIFATYHEKENRAMIILDEIEQSVYCTIPHGGFSAVPGAWGKQGATYIDLSVVTKEVFQSALQSGYAFILSKGKPTKKQVPLVVKKNQKTPEEKGTTTRYYDSKFNGRLEVTMRDGIKVLDTDHTNYSYGTVQQVWAQTLKKIKSDKIETVLLLGLGGGSVIDLLRNKFHYPGFIHVVEIDPVIIEVAKVEFNIHNTTKTKIICDDAFHFVETAKKKFDLILVDIFLDRIMPDNATSHSFWNSLGNRLNPKGLVIFNVFHYGKKMKKFENEMTRNGWKIKIYEKVNGTNTMVFAKKT